MESKSFEEVEKAVKRFKKLSKADSLIRTGSSLRKDDFTEFSDIDFLGMKEVTVTVRNGEEPSIFSFDLGNGNLNKRN